MTQQIRELMTFNPVSMPGTASVQEAARTRILIVDDYEFIGIAFVEALRYAGYQAHAEQSALEAVRMATQEPFDVVFTDLLMPEMSGIEVCQAIKRACPKTQVVLISGHPEAARAQRDAFLSAGGHAEILPKPIDIDTLLKVTQRLVPPVHPVDDDASAENSGV
jgi:CheY-like chemotaxis protein